MNAPFQLPVPLADPTLLRTEALIDGQWLARDAQLAVNNPANGEDISRQL